jgi:soluble lytic murein transglycosylase-like protein
MKIHTKHLFLITIAYLSLSIGSEVRAQDDFLARPRFAAVKQPVSRNPMYGASPRVIVVGNAVKSTALISPAPSASSTTTIAANHFSTSNLNSGLKGYTTGDREIDSFIVDSSRRYAVDPLLIYSQMNQESGFKQHATSDKGASGLMQIMPETAKRLGVANIYDPKQNIDGGVKYMRILLDMFSGNIDLALAGYNAGEGAVIKYGYQIPPYSETQDYVRRISARYHSIANSASKQKGRG